ncbi:hypothetical protein ACFY4K_34055 [Streptomyces leeuwenhoekii]|uniref:hypothetical protein n=1 Tax=Streptomyces leeuwenhoekii TaxID=1437453 RepID=UPI0036B2499D
MVATKMIAARHSRSPARRRPPPCGRMTSVGGTTRRNSVHNSSGTNRSTRSVEAQHHLSDHFMWITWAPFRANSWSTLNSPGQVEATVLQRSSRVFGNSDTEEARKLLDSELARSVAARL